MKLAIAFGSGGTRGLASLGLMTKLLEAGIRPVAVSGSSIGAFIAAYYGVHGETDTLRDWYEKAPPRAFFSYVSTGSFRHSLMDTSKLRVLVKGFLKNKSFADTCVPVTVVATDLFSGRAVPFRKGKLLAPVMASGSIPGLLPPVKIGRRYYVDGGVTDPTPIDYLPRRKDVQILGIDYTIKPEGKVKRPNVKETISLAFDATRKAIIDHQREHHHPGCVIVHPSQHSTDKLLLDNIKDHYRNGERIGVQLLRKWKRQGLL